MKWQTPPVIKIYEALGAVVDGRVQVDGNTAKVYSSSGKKYYDVIFDPAQNAITSNDNGSYWKGYCGYPSLVLLFILDVLPINQDFAESLKGIAWKDINTKFKNDFSQTEEYVRSIMKEHGINLEEFDVFAKDIITKINELGLEKLASNAKPPKEY